MCYLALYLEWVREKKRERKIISASSTLKLSSEIEENKIEGYKENHTESLLYQQGEKSIFHYYACNDAMTNKFFE